MTKIHRVFKVDVVGHLERKPSVALASKTFSSALGHEIPTDMPALRRIRSFLFQGSHCFLNYELILSVSGDIRARLDGEHVAVELHLRNASLRHKAKQLLFLCVFFQQSVMTHERESCL